MKKFLLCSAIFCIFTTPLISSAAHSSLLTIPANKIVPVELLIRRFTSLKIKDLQKLAGRKFSIKEKIAFLVLKKKLGHKPGEGQNQGQIALIFGIAALTLLVLGLLISAAGVPLLASLVSSVLAIVVGSVAKKKDPADRKAHAGKLLGWITLGLIALLVIAAAIVLASWSWI